MHEVSFPSSRRTLGRVTRPPGTPRWLTLTTLCLAALVTQLDTSVMNLATRPIGVYFDASVGALQWVVDSYNLIYAVFLLTGGLLADLYGRRRIFAAGATVFTAASLLCAVAWSIPVLILGRVVAGIGAALLLPASLSIIRVVWPESNQRARALGIWAACNGLAFAIGPTTGGVLIACLGWRSIFLVVIPVGVAASGIAYRAIPESSDPQHRELDIGAQVLGALSLGAFVVAAIEAHTQTVLAGGAFGCALLAGRLFVSIEANKGQAALVPLDMLYNREFRAAVTGTAAMTFGMYGVLFLLPLSWQASGRLEPVGTGSALIPMALVFALLSPFSDRLESRLGTRVTTSVGLGIIGTGLLVIGLSVHLASMVPAEFGLGLTGLGMGFATGPLVGAAVKAVSAARSGTAAAVINAARMTGATAGVAVLGSIFAAKGGGADGLRLAMIIGGLVQIAAALTVWKAAPTPLAPPSSAS